MTLTKHHFLRGFLAIAAIALLAAAVPDDDTVARLRKQIEERRQQRRDAEPVVKVVELKQLGVSIQDGWPDLNKAGDLAVIRIMKDSAEPAKAIRIIPLGRDLEPIAIPNWGRGDQWVSLEPGHWRLEMTVGPTGDQQKEKVETGELTLNRRGRYELRLDDMQ